MTFEKEIQNMAHVKLSEEFFATINRQKQVLQNTICNIIDTAREDDKEQIKYSTMRKVGILLWHEKQKPMFTVKIE